MRTVADREQNGGGAAASRRFGKPAGVSPFRVVSFFAGCGGLDLGFRGDFVYRGEEYRRLPFQLLKAYEFEERCQATYEQNVGKHFELCDLSTADVSEMPAADVLIGGFPCQEFSICGPRRGIQSQRGNLFKVMSRYARHHKPMVVVAENVAHIARLNDGEDLATIRRSFARAGYRSYVWSMFAPDYGVPQARDRVVLVFVRSDIKQVPEAPRRSFADNHRSIEWAIGDLIEVADESVPNQSQYFKAGLAASGHGQGDETSRKAEPGYTVRANAKSRVQFHYSLPRRLTVRECARLQTFPDEFIFPHAATTNIMQIGNAVPPVLGHVVACQMEEFLGGVVRKNKSRTVGA
ncbi:DNA cytosine methyltransferase [Paraburkholderia tropica]|uniref:DNA cytosine methyltransferase n=1 Tax=Paraburkholderia tropica TaxID=92647 RepID=UPI0016000750|nr:DNA (cytosine-5-)-methyltransferase [Paraburkholderia tropica]QNB10797.1 DNA cytosine methyltransferase [Paraburkholderia tropica]